MTFRSRSFLVLALLSGCAKTPPPEPATPPAPPAESAKPARPSEPLPTGRLPSDVTPHAYALDLQIDPSKETFTGKTDIQIETKRLRSTIFLHAKNLTVQKATVTPSGGEPIAATLSQVNVDGLAALELDKPMSSGAATIHVEYEAPFARGLKGLYRVETGGQAYAYTQFEAIAAREAFPCFDEPSFKTSFKISVTAPLGQQAIANSRVVRQTDSALGTQFFFAETKSIPTYLVALAVGPLDVVNGPDVPPNDVRHRPLALRGVTTKGRGKEISYALAHAGEILTALEKYTGVEYPYEKLDLLAVPEKEGAMENPGAVTFAEPLLLLDEKTAPIRQKRAYTGVVAHELAHQWFGDLVTMPWWNDIWLNEAFATWMAAGTADKVRSDMHANVTLLERVEDAMGLDGLASARAVRQPVETTHDIRNAFDAITYQKGGGVLSMFERWLGPDVFQKGIHAYLVDHKYGTATTDDLVAALSKASGKDVATPFKTFLDQPGVPLVEANLVCEKKARVELKQSRYVPLGSPAANDRKWQIPVCVRYPSGGKVKQACTLLAESKGSVELETTGCPDWVFPNADAAGYFRVALAPAEVAKLERTGLEKLSTREKLALADGIRASLGRGAAPFDDSMTQLAALVKDPYPGVASAPVWPIAQARDWLYADKTRAAVEAYGRSLYTPVYKDLGWEPKKKNEDPERELLRQQVISFLANVARDPAVRAEAKKRGEAWVGYKGDGKIHPEAVNANLVDVALAVAVEDGDAAFFDALVALLGKTEDELTRTRIVTALGAADQPMLAAKARALALDPKLRANEVFLPLRPQFDDPTTRDMAWEWLRDHTDEIVRRVSTSRAGGLPFFGARFCTDSRAGEVETFFRDRIRGIEGGPRNLEEAVEAVRICAARRGKYEGAAKAFFAKAGK